MTDLKRKLQGWLEMHDVVDALEVAPQYVSLIKPLRRPLAKKLKEYLATLGYLNDHIKWERTPKANSEDDTFTCKVYQ